MLDILAAATGAAAPPAWVTWLPILGMVLIFWFLIIRPQMRQQKEHREKVAGLKRGDEVVTAGASVSSTVEGMANSTIGWRDQPCCRASSKARSI